MNNMIPINKVIQMNHMFFKLQNGIIINLNHVVSCHPVSNYQRSNKLYMSNSEMGITITDEDYKILNSMFSIITEALEVSE